MRTLSFLPLLLIAFGFSKKEPVTPRLFQPELFASLPNVRDLAISPDGSEMYFTVESYKKEFSAIAFTRKNDGGWPAPQLVAFSGKYRDLEPFLSADGLKLYFSSARPVSDTATQPKDVDIWYVTRKALFAPWSAPVNAGATVNSEKDEYYPSVALNGNLYFTRLSDDAARKEDIWRSAFRDGKYEKPAALNDSVNSLKYEYNAFVAPDESYILFTSYGRVEEMGGSDLYISVKDKAGNWRAAKHLGALNSTKIDYCPYVSRDGKTLYFTSERSEFPASFSEPQQIGVFTRPTISNGQSRIYSVPFDVTFYR